MKRRIISSEAYERELGSAEWLLSVIFSFLYGLPVALTVLGGPLMCLFVPGWGVSKISSILSFTVFVIALKTALAILCNSWRLGLMFLVLYGAQLAVVFMACNDYIRILLDIRRNILG